MKITQSKNRRVTATADPRGFVQIVESVRYIRTGFTRGRWEDDRIVLTKEELAKIAAEADRL